MAVPANRVVIGLDFGTTFTGVAFQAVGQARNGQFNLVRDWPGGAITDKVPSEISYSPAEDGASQWGGHFSPGSVNLVWTKLQLDKQKRPDELDMILAALEGTKNLDFKVIQQNQGLPSYPAKGPVEVVSDYLEHVRGYLWRDLLSIYGETVLNTTAFDIVFTVPADWSEPAKNRTFRAICKAGFDNDHFNGLREVIMVSEPEATAVSILKTLRPRFGEQDLLPGDSFVVCDAGGGTVDLVSYQIRQIAPELEIGEITPGTGDKCGATFIDRRFRQWLERRLGKTNFQGLTETSAHDRIGSHTIVEYRMGRIMREFEQIKKRFAGIGRVGDEFITLPPPLNDLTDPQNGIADGEIRITELDLKDMFQFSVQRTNELILGQIASVELAGSRVRRVFLSGGFAESPYLYNEVQETLRLSGIRLERPSDAWSSVVRGAVAWGIETDARKMIYMRSCRRNYGLSVSEPFSSFKHSEEDAYIDDFDREKKAKEQMIWLIKKGDAIMSNQPKHASINLCRKFGRSDPRIFRTYLVSSDDVGAPQRFADIPEAKRSVTRIIYDFTDIPEDRLTSARAAGRRSAYFLVNFQIDIQVATNVQVWVTCNGNEMTRIPLSY